MLQPSVQGGIASFAPCTVHPCTTSHRVSWKERAVTTRHGLFEMLLAAELRYCSARHCSKGMST